MRHQNLSSIVRWVEMLAAAMLVAPALLACGGSGDDEGSDDDRSATAVRTSSSSDGRTPDGGGPAEGAVSDVPDVLELGVTYRFEMPEEIFEKRFSLVVPAGSVVTVEASAADGNSGSTSFSFGPTTGQLRRLEIPRGQSVEPYKYITSSDGGGNWSVQVQGRSGNTIEFRVTAPLQSDGGTEGDAGSNATATKDVSIGTAFSGLLGDEDTEDWYAIPLNGGDVVEIGFDMLDDTGAGGVSADLVFNGEPLVSASVFPGGEASLAQIFADDQAGTAQLRLFGVGSYNVTIAAGPQQDGGIEGDAGGDQVAARDVDFGRIEGVLGGEDLRDFYRLTLPLAAVVTIEGTVDAAGRVPTEINVTYNGQDLIVGGDRISPGQTKSYTFVLNNQADEELILQLSSGGRYSLEIGAFTQTDGGTGQGDAPNEEGLAMEVVPEGSFEGWVNNARSFDTRDWYRFTATTTGPLTITLEVDPEIGANVNGRIRELGGRQLGQLNAGAGGRNTATIDVEAGKQYSLQVSTGLQAKYTITFGE